ncbi:ABC transporter permease [Pontibacter sp. 172403-2]|uniref:ABC transporter permease n=1 Tax=Pontibacter rufus TaxID=2791028 RepID=UPI0018AF7EF7|nr:ABC transporter permease [Pontibacter sp. 172403-2]MBF9254883.1 ABC transporter permease [Pontibacter sp. 172403-2]
MKRLLYNFRQLWLEKLIFRLVTVYLALLVVLVLVLPWLPLPFAPNYLDLNHIFQPPFANVQGAGAAHWFGTDALGRDVLTETLYGARTGLFISLPVVITSTFIGLMLGAGAGFFGDNQLRISRAALLLSPLLLFPLFYFGLYLPLHIQQYHLPASYMWLSWGTLALLLGISWLLHLVLQRLAWFRYKAAFPLDMLIIRVIEVVSSVPWLILVLLLASFMPPSVMLLSLILIFTNWTHTARLARAEMLRIKAMPYMEAGRALGFTDARLVLKQALPNMMGPVLVAFGFSLAALLTLESTLSFLGIGLPPTIVSWGRTITGIRSNTSAWWLVAFPGGFLALTVLALQTFSYYLRLMLQNNSKI